MPPDIFVDNHGTGYQNVTGGDGPQTNINGVRTQNNYYGRVQDPHTIKAETRRKEEKKRKEKEELQMEQEDCLGSLSFPSMNARRDNIDDAHPNTCDWLFNTTEFTEWRRRDELPAHNGVLWIKGKPGAGKSTLMNHTLSYCERTLHDHLIVSYFFNARGGVLEKTPLGMMRSIVYQLIRGGYTLYRAFLDSYRERVRITKEGELQWQVPQLKKFIQSIMKQPHLHSKPLLLLVDALDECAEEEVRDVVGFLETLSVTAINVGVELRICLSSRHYPLVSMKKNLELTVEGRQEHGTDIAAYIQQKLNTDDSSLEGRVREKAHGIFLWVVLVVAMLNKAHDEGRHEAMQKTLDELPEGLEGMFDMILGRGDSDKAEMISMFQWVLFCRRPLSPKELYTAVVSRSLPSSETIRRRITTSSKGLIEIRGEVSPGGSVQFIHLSVRDFLCRSGRLGKMDPTLQPDAISLSHACIWASCWSYIKHIDRHATSTNVDAGVFDRHQFLDYTANYILTHAEEALSNDAVGPRLDREIAHWIGVQGGSRQWFEWLNLVSGSIPRPIKTIWATTGLGTTIGWLIYLLACGFHPTLLEFALKKGADVNARLWAGGPNALEMAVEHGEERAVKLLLGKGANINCGALYKASSRSDYDMAQLLLSRGADVNAQDTVDETGDPVTALQAACASQDSYRISKLLIDSGANVNAQVGRLGTALQAACICGNGYEASKLLIESGTNVNARGGEFGTALQAACYYGNDYETGDESVHEDGYEASKLLIESSANVNARESEFGTALQAAAYFSRRRMAELLIESGADVNARGGEFGTALQAATYFDRRHTAKLLIESGADVNARGSEFGTALQAAAYFGRRRMVELLIKNGADVNAPGGKFGTALQAATRFRTSYHAISDSSRRRTAKLLIENGADVNAPGGEFGTALQAAHSGGDDRPAGLLAESDAENPPKPSWVAEIKNILRMFYWGRNRRRRRF